MSHRRSPWFASCPTWLAVAAIVLALAAAYANGLTGPFVLDDIGSIRDNLTIRRLWPLDEVLRPPPGRGETVEGRPILNLSFAVNHALSGPGVRGYHVGNVAIHILATLALFGVVRRTLRRGPGDPPAGATALAGLAALAWGLHPLQVESVTYLSQRAESLMGLFFLCSLYAAIRAAGTERHRTPWTAASVAAAWLCVGTKEVAVALPLVILVYDRTFLAGSPGGTWRARRGLYAGLGLAWVLLAALVAATGDRGGTIGAAAGITPWEYALCQARGLVHYVRLAVWPTPLVFDYGSDFVTFREALPWGLMVLGTLGLVVRGVVRRTPLGFLGAWFFLILGPSSSVVGGSRQMLSEHRLYLPLAAVIVALGLVLHRVLGRRLTVAGPGLLAALAVSTVVQNGAYASAASLWNQVVARRPSNHWAYNNLGVALADELGRPAEALAAYQASLRIRPDYAEAHTNLGNLYAGALRRPEDARAAYETALRLKPGHAETHYNLARLLAEELGRPEDARRHYEAALASRPGHVEAHNNLGALLAGPLRRPSEARSHYEAALALRPGHLGARINLAVLLADQLGQPQVALAQYAEVLRLQPGHREARYNLGALYANHLDRPDLARAEFEAVLRLDPGYEPARTALRLLGP